MHESVCMYVWSRQHGSPCMYVCMYIARHATVYAFVFACIWTFCNQTMSPEALLYIHLTLLAYSPNKYVYYTAHICPTALLLSLHVQTVHVSLKKTETFICHAITIYVPTTSVPLKCHIWKLVHVQIQGNCVSMYTWYELTASIMSPKTLVYIHITLLAY